MDFSKVENYRKNHPLGYEHKIGDDFGWFEIPGPCGRCLACMVSPSDLEWQHVSVSPMSGNRPPNWEEMCFIKNLFWDENECVVQYHPPKSEYINLASNCLHLWRLNKNPGFPMPPKICV